MPLHEPQLDAPDSSRPEQTEPELIGAPSVEYDRSTLDMVMHLEDAAVAIRDLQILVAIWPEDQATVEEHTQSIANSMGAAYAARDRFVTFHRLLAGLPATNPS